MRLASASGIIMVRLRRGGLAVRAGLGWDRVRSRRSELGLRIVRARLIAGVLARVRPGVLGDVRESVGRGCEGGMSVGIENIFNLSN